MKIPRLLPALVALALASCGGARGAVGGKIVPLPEIGRGVRDTRSPGVETGDAPAPRIPVAPEDRVVAVLEAPLDADAAAEQVIAVKRRDDVNSPVRVLVADSDGAPGRSGRYTLSWQSVTRATSTRVFALTATDLVGDHSLQIVVSGMDGDGRRTLDVYRRAPAAGGQHVSFRPVASIAADDIRIDSVERSEAYTAGQKNGESFGVSAFSRDSASTNVMDIVRVPYAWRAEEGRYTAGPAEKIPGEKVEQKQMENLYTSADTDAFESFLDGTWIDSRALTDASGPGRSYGIVHFQPGDRRISLSTGDTEEVYLWRESLRTLYDRILVTAVNDEKPAIARTFSIRATSPNTLEMTNQGSDTGDIATNTYSRITGDLRGRLLDASAASALLKPAALSGTYMDGTGRRLAFSRDRVTWTEAGRARTGECAFFTLGDQDIVTFRFLDEKGSVAETRNYAVAVHEKRDLGRTVRTLVLTPAQLTVSGYEESVGERLSLEQTPESSRN